MPKVGDIRCGSTSCFSRCRRALTLYGPWTYLWLANQEALTWARQGFLLTFASYFSCLQFFFPFCSQHVGIFLDGLTWAYWQVDIFWDIFIFLDSCKERSFERGWLNYQGGLGAQGVEIQSLRLQILVKLPKRLGTRRLQLARFSCHNKFL